jgi:hypothetical protein
MNHTLKKTCSWTKILLTTVLLGSVCSSLYPANPPIVFENSRWTLSLEPESFSVAARLPGDEPFHLSIAQESLGPISDLRIDGNKAEWNYGQLKVSVRVELKEEDFSVWIRSTNEGAFTWPIFEQDEKLRGLILPRWEGCYAPLDDRVWVDYLIEQGGWDTLAGFCMPFWGLDRGAYTVTFLAVNPYNNQLEFSRPEGKLTGRFTHEFPSINPQKEYGFLISLGNASPVQPAKRYRRWLIEQNQFVSWKEKLKAVPKAERLLGAMQIYLWGDGISPQMIRRFQEEGLDRARFCVDDKRNVEKSPETAVDADKSGYLFGTYDAYHSIHDPASAGTDESWDTAQFDRDLYEKGPIVGKNGKKKAGFKQIGYQLSPIAARPYVEKRVRENMKQVPYNYYFVDCDAFGEVYDDYSPNHPATQAEDAAERNSRMAWIRDTFGLVIGSEGGSAYAAPVVHVVEGMISPVIGWSDPEMRDKKSTYYIGRYYPPEGPEIFLKTVPIKEKYNYLYYNTRFRLPLYETVFHDSVMATNHWGSGSLKFKEVQNDVALTQLLYQVPPLYHLSLKEFENRKEPIKSYNKIFSPLHRKLGFSQMTDFTWLTEDRLVQQTVFDETVEITANFRETDYSSQNGVIPKRSVCVKWRDTGDTQILTP